MNITIKELTCSLSFSLFMATALACTSPYSFMLTAILNAGSCAEPVCFTGDREVIHISQKLPIPEVLIWGWSQLVLAIVLVLSN